MASLALPTPIPAASRPEAPLCPPPPARQRPAGCEQLNEDQLRAVTAPADGALIIFAPAGAGKTLTLVHRATWLVGRGLAAASVLCLTFSRKAAAELRGRLPPAAAGVEVCTFHAWCLRLLRAFAAELGRPAGFSLSSSAQQIELIRQALEAFQQQQGGGTSGASTAGTGTQARKSQSVMAACRRFQRVIGEAKLLPDGAPAGGASDKAPAASGKLLETELGAFIWRHYNDGLRKAGLVDMGDLQRFALTLLRTPHVAAAVRGRYRHVLIDEYQDTNLQQLAIVRAICAKEPSAQTVGVTVVGDDDQVRGSSTLAVPRPPCASPLAWLAQGDEADDEAACRARGGAASAPRAPRLPILRGAHSQDGNLTASRLTGRLTGRLTPHTTASTAPAEGVEGGERKDAIKYFVSV